MMNPEIQGFNGTQVTHSNVDPECNHYVPPLRLRLMATHADTIVVRSFDRKNLTEKFNA